MNQQSPVRAATVVLAIFEAVQSSPNGIPSGHVYAACMGLLTLDQYQQVIDALVKPGLIRESNHVLFPVQTAP